MTPEVIPPRVPQFNWVDLGLPSGTLWLDRLVGATSPSEPGLFYQWGDIVGHTAEDSYNFSIENYQAKGLGLISSDLDDAHDAAKAYYGPVAKMPTVNQFQELIANCNIASTGNGLVLITSNINGNSITVRANGGFSGLQHLWIQDLCAWSSTHVSETLAPAFTIEPTRTFIPNNSRYIGFNIMAVHS